MRTKALFLVITVSYLSVSIAQTHSKSMMKVDYKSLISKADLSYDTPVTRSEEGMPIGNGVTGSLVWTTPTAMHFQINRTDVFAMGSNTRSFPDGHTNYSNGCGYVDINMVDYGDDVFTGDAFKQHLSVYNGLATVKGKDITARVLAWNAKDVIATEIDDQRDNPSAINIDLRMLRYSVNYIRNQNFNLTSQHAVQIKTGAHSATSQLEIRDGRIILTQKFIEGDYYSASAVAIGVVGRDSKAKYYNESTVRLSVAPGKGKSVVLTSSASSTNPEEDVAALALEQIDAAQAKNFNTLLSSNQDWWKNYWSKSFIHLHSADGIADFVEKNYTYFLYVMGSCSRGDYMPGFRGMLWYTNGDLAQWGSQFWWNNQGFYFNGLTPSNHPELIEPIFRQSTRNYKSYAKAAEQQWGSKGIWIPETNWHDGLEDLPDAIAEEMRALYLNKKPWKERSEAFKTFALNKNNYNSRWNWIAAVGKKGKEKGPFAWTSHIFSTTAKISYLYWLKYAYGLDKEWLKNEAYPMVKGTAEFYRNFPNFYKGKDGVYHIQHINNLEGDWGGSDSPEELAAMYALFPIAIEASEILGVDQDLRLKWKEIYENLPSLPRGEQLASYYDLFNINSNNKTLSKRVLESYQRKNPNGISENINMHVGNRDGVTAAKLGLANDVKYMLPAIVKGTEKGYIDFKGSSGENGKPVLRNRLSLREGAGAIECQRLGEASHVMYQALLQSAPASPGETVINSVFPAWPKAWDVQFTLAARNGFLISASMEKGKVEFVEIHSQKGGECRIKNPWNNKEITIYRDGKKSENIKGTLLKIQTNKGELVNMVPKGKRLKSKEVQ